jgi:hypothetical protein
MAEEIAKAKAERDVARAELDTARSDLRGLRVALAVDAAETMRLRALLDRALADWESAAVCYYLLSGGQCRCLSCDSRRQIQAEARRPEVS